MAEKFKKILALVRELPILPALAATLGILLIIAPAGAAVPIMVGLGIALLLYALLRIVGVFLLGERGVGSAMTLTLCIGVVLFSVSLIAAPDEGFASVAQLSGIYLALEGGIGLFRLMLLRSPTYVRLCGIAPPTRVTLAVGAVLYTLSLALGIYLLYFTAGNSSNLPCAAALIISGASSLLAWVLRTRGQGSKAPTDADGYVEAEFEDKTDE